MSNFDVSTPQLKAAKNFMDAFVSLSICDLMTSLSKNFQYEAFGGATNLAKMDMEVCAEAMQGLFVGLTKLDVNFTYHEVIEAPGKVIIQFSTLCNTASGATLTYDSGIIISVEEEDGELKVLSIKALPDAQQYNAIMAVAAKAAAERGSAS